MRRLIAAMLLMFSCTASAEIEKLATTTDTGIHFMWWPKVVPPKGWHFDQGSSYRYAFNALAPDGFTFSNAEVVMYARADYKPHIPDVRSLEAYIARDVADFKANEPSIAVTREPAILLADHRSFEVVSYRPGDNAAGNWERVAYGEESDYFVTFVISARSETGLNRDMPDFRSMLAHYRNGS